MNSRDSLSANNSFSSLQNWTIFPVYPHPAIIYLSLVSPNAQPIISPGMKILQLHATRNDDKLSAGYPLLWMVSQQHYTDWSKVTRSPRYKNVVEMQCHSSSVMAIINEVINYCIHTWTFKLQSNHIVCLDTLIMWLIHALWISFIVMYC